MSECEAGGVGISCPGGCGVICSGGGKKRKCVAMCNPEVSVFKFGGKFSLTDKVTFCAHNLRPESLTVLFQHALPNHRVKASVAKLKRVVRHTGQVGEIATRLGLSVQRKPTKKRRKTSSRLAG
jgi:hypothetical protein